MRSRSCLGRALAALVTAALVSSTHAGTSLARDTSFFNSGWAITPFVTGSGSVVGSQDVARGNPAPSRKVTSTAGPGTSIVRGCHRLLSIFPIASRDQIVSVQWSFDVDALTAPTHDFALAILQDGVWYRSPLRVAIGSGFVTLGETSVVGDLVRVDGQPGHLDFGPYRAPIQVGFYTQHSSGAATVVAEALVDNFSALVTCVDVAPAIIHEYQFNGNAVDNISGANGVIGADALFTIADVPFSFGSALSVPASSAGTTVTIPRAAFHSLRGSSFTISFWWKNYGDDTDFNPILNAADTNGWRILLTPASKLRFNWIHDGAGTFFESPMLSLGTGWHHVALVCDRESPSSPHWHIDWYLDGHLLNTQSADALDDVDLDHDQDVLIGKQGSEALDGELDQLRVYNFPLNAAQVASFYNVDPCPTDVDHNGTVGLSDIAALILEWGTSCP